jgi:hypothetical protein
MEPGDSKPAQCRTYVLTSGTFVQDDCGFEPDPQWTPIGQFSSGICCYISGLSITTATTNRGFGIRSCGGECDGGGLH